MLRERFAGGEAVSACGLSERLRLEESSGGRVGPIVVIATCFLAGALQFALMRCVARKKHTCSV